MNLKDGIFSGLLGKHNLSFDINGGCGNSLNLFEVVISFFHLSIIWAIIFYY